MVRDPPWVFTDFLWSMDQSNSNIKSNPFVCCYILYLKFFQLKSIVFPYASFTLPHYLWVECRLPLAKMDSVSPILSTINYHWKFISGLTFLFGSDTSDHKVVLPNVHVPRTPTLHGTLKFLSSRIHFSLRTTQVP